MRWKDLFKAKASAWHNWRNDMTRFIGEIKDDAYAEAPEDDACHIGFLSSSRYCLGTKRCTSEELQAIEKSKAVWLPVYAYVHSGSTISTKPFSCLWDSGQSGIAWMAYEDALLIFGEHKFGKRVLTAAGRAKAEEYIRGTVECFDKWLTGEACGWVITDTQTGEEVDSCWGYYDRKYCEQEMLESVAQRNQDADDSLNLAAVQAGVLL